MTLSIKAFGLAVAACALTAFVAWWRLDGSIHPDQGGLKPIGHYARTASSGNPRFDFHIGAAGGEDIVVPDLPPDSSARIVVTAKTWQLATGPTGTSIGTWTSPLQGSILEPHGKYVLRRGNRSLDIQLERPLRVVVTVRGSKESEVWWLRPAGGPTITDTGITLRPSERGLFVERGGKTGSLSGYGQVKAGDVTAVWAKDDAAVTPLYLTSSGTSDLIWPGQIRFFPSVSGLLRFSIVKAPLVSVSSTDPQSELTLIPGGVVSGLASGGLFQPLQLDRRSYRILTFEVTAGSERRRLTAIERIPAIVKWWGFLTGGPLQSWDDRTVFNPYRFIRIPECGNSATSFWIPPEAASPRVSAAPPGGTDNVEALKPPSWMAAAERGRGATFCRQRDAFRVAGVSELGTNVPPPFDAVLRSTDAAPQSPGGATTLRLSAGDTVFIAGQIFLLSGESMPQSLALPALTGSSGFSPQVQGRSVPRPPGRSANLCAASGKYRQD